MRSFRARRIVSLLSILLLSLASAGCPELNRQPDYMGKQLMSTDRPLPTIAAVGPAKPVGQAFDQGNVVISN